VAFLQRAARRTGLLPALIFFAALLPRLSALGRYVTPDELNWVYRSIGLRQALLAGGWAGTLQSGHPGVVTTWIGAAAVQLQLWLREGAGNHLAWLEQMVQLSQDNVEAYRRLAFFLDGGRLGVALIASLGMVAVYLAGRQVVGRRAALAGGLFLALDPYFAGLSGLLHVDALLTVFMALALLLALAATDGEKQAAAGRYAALSGACTGLALLSKTPALLLLPFIPAMFLWTHLRPAQGRARRWPWRPLLLWAGTLLATTLLLLPALWAAPRATLEAVAGLSGRLAGDAVRPTFFLGESVLDPGALFYPVTVLFRLSPAAWLGLLLVAPAWKTVRRRHGSRASTRPIAWFLLFGLAFLLFISFVAKKHDRYALPALVALTLAAGWGTGLYAGREAGKGWRQRIAPTLIALQAAYLFLYLPYPLTAYNWLAGGGDAAARALPAGWGEGAGAGARWLAATVPRPEEATLFTTNTTGTAPFFPGEIIRFDRSTLPLLEVGDYILLVQRDAQLQSAIVTDRVVQEGALPEGGLLKGEEPLQRVAFKGATRAVVYEGLGASAYGVPSLEMAAQALTFGGEVGLAAAGAVPAAWPAGMLVGVTWERGGGALSPPYQIRFSLVDDRDRVRTSWEQPLLNRVDFAPIHWPAGAPQTVFYAHLPPPDLPPGDYGVTVEVFNAQGERLGVFDGAGRFQGVQPVLETVNIGPRSEETTLEIPKRTEEGSRYGEVVGYGPWPAEVGTGETLTLDLWWRAEAPGQGELLLLMGDAELATTLDTRNWYPGQIYHIRPAWRLPGDVEAGRYRLQLQRVDEDGRRWPEPLVLGEIDVAARERTFELPPGLRMLNVRLGTVTTLQEARAEWEGDELLVHVVWQADEPDGEAYTTFVHLRDEDGGIVAQVDRPPEPATSSWLPGQVVAETYRLAQPPPGRYTVAVGLYDPISGHRLPVYDAGGERLAHDQHQFEVTAP